MWQRKPVHIMAARKQRERERERESGRGKAPVFLSRIHSQ
jgi:hypothetical protein